MLACCKCLLKSDFVGSSVKQLPLRVTLQHCTRISNGELVRSNINWVPKGEAKHRPNIFHKRTALDHDDWLISEYRNCCPIRNDNISVLDTYM